jgi:hypothetical protein
MINTKLQPLSYQVANMCSVCGETIPHVFPNGFTLVSIDGKRQKIVDAIQLAAGQAGRHAVDDNGDWTYCQAEEVPVICVEVRE